MKTTVTLEVEVKIDCYVKPNKQEMAELLGAVIDAGLADEEWSDFIFDALVIRVLE